MEATAERIRTARSLDRVPLTLIRQRWDQPDIQDIPAAVRAQLARCGAFQRLKPGGTVAITAGSRGIASKPAVLRAVVQAVREAGGQPFIFPAMGSHGGGTAEGQRALLADLGVSEETMGVPVRATMDVVQIGQTEDGMPVYLDAIAAQADGIIVVNRVKKHTNFDGPIESGLCKMAVIGMGKHRQAVAVHQFGNPGLRRYVPEVARTVFAKAPVLAGLAILENAWGGLAELVGLAPEEIVEREPALFQQAKALSAKLPFQEMDIALVERMGKEISGTGLDCYVIGRRRIVGEPEWEEAPRISSLVLADITPASHGNGLGVGLADFTTRRLVEQIDWEITRTNIMTSGNLERGKVPLVFDTLRDAMEAAAFRERAKPLEALRIACFRDTLHLRHLLVSPALAAQACARDDLEVLKEGLAWPYDAAGNWLSPFDGLS
jgi:hypothetical protein